MMRFKRSLCQGLAGVVAFGALATVLTGPGPAQADPPAFKDAINGFGSDAIQAVTNAFAGYEAGVDYRPLRSATGTQMNSWDATPDNECLQTKPGSPSFHRPNGSSEGRYMLSQAIAGGTNYASGTCGLKNITGVIDFARSSSTVATGSTGPLLYAPFAKDALGFAYYKNDKAGATPAVTTLTRTQIAIITNTDGGVLFSNGTRVIACEIQAGSGTGGDWNQFITGNKNGNYTGTRECRQDLVTTSDDPNGKLQENKSQLLVDKGDQAPPNVQVIIGYSVAGFIAVQEGAAPGPIVPPSKVDMGIIEEINADGVRPYLVNDNGTAGELSDDFLEANSLYYNALFGRLVSYVVPTSLIYNGANIRAGSSTLKQMFFSPVANSVDLRNGEFGMDDPATISTVRVARICHTDALLTQRKFGFLLSAECGTQRQGPLVTAVL